MFVLSVSLALYYLCKSTCFLTKEQTHDSAKRFVAIDFFLCVAYQKYL